MRLLDSAWMLTPVLVYALASYWLARMADRSIPKSHKRLPFEIGWGRRQGRRFAIWNLPVTGWVLGVMLFGVDIRFAITGPHLRSLPERLFATAWPLLLLLIVQMLLIVYQQRWVALERARRTERRRQRRKELKSAAPPATPPTT